MRRRWNAGRLDRRDHDDASRLDLYFDWLFSLSVLTALVAGPIVGVFAGRCCCAV